MLDWRPPICGWRTGPPVRMGPYTLIAVEYFERRGAGSCRAAFGAVVKKPCALLVMGGPEIEVIGTDGRAMSLDTVRDWIPGLDDILGRHQQTHGRPAPSIGVSA